MGPPLDRGGRAGETAPPRRRKPCFNGATARSRWKGQLMEWKNHHLLRLQWGHRSIAVEGLRNARRGRVATQASMGPPLDRGGRMWAFCSRRDGIVWLQWGHRSIAVEGSAGSATITALLAASMGPPLDRGGRGKPEHGRGARRYVASMGPPLDRGGRIVVSFLYQTDSGGFNGATARSRWKGKPIPERYRESISASMGPPLDRGGRRGCGRNDRRRAGGASMGPPLDRGGRRCSMNWPPISFELLQWGHRSIAVEGRLERSSESRKSLSFNGATARSRWKVLNIKLPRGSYGSFNGATARSRWKGRRRSSTCSRSSSLQWGHRSIAVEGQVHLPGAPSRVPASMGPPLDRGGSSKVEGV